MDLRKMHFNVTYGDLSDGCNNYAHFNPFGNTHGCPGMKNRHR